MALPRTLKLDFAGVEARGLLTEGVHRLQVDDVEMKEGKKAPYISWKLKAKNGAVVYDNTSTSPRALWRLKAVLEALGEDNLQGGFNFSPRRYRGKWLTASISHEEYNGKTKPVIEAYITPEEAAEHTASGEGPSDDFEEGAAHEPDEEAGAGKSEGPATDDLDDETPF